MTSEVERAAEEYATRIYGPTVDGKKDFIAGWKAALEYAEKHAANRSVDASTSIPFLRDPWIHLSDLRRAFEGEK